MTTREAAPEGLGTLEARLRRDLELLDYPPDNWVIERRAPATTRADAPTDVLIVGAGLCGMTAAFALLRSGIRNLRLLDASPAGHEGPWVTYARMETLRSPKHLTGPAMGVASLTFRAWFEAQWGARAWEALGRIERTMWMDDLRWYRRALALPVKNDARVTAIAPGPDGFTVAVHSQDGASTLNARKVVLATGREGLAAPRIPQPLLPFRARYCLHTCESIDFRALRGKTVAVVGVAASALDNAGMALEAGAAQVVILARAPAMPRINKAKGIVYGGFTEGFPGLGLAERLRTLDYIFECRIAPPRESLLRVARHQNARIELDAPLVGARPERERLVLATPGKEFAVDKVILGTGFRIDVHAAPELRSLAPAIATCRDEFEPRAHDAASELLDSPDLGEGFEFREKTPGMAPCLKDLHCFNFAAALSHGNVSGDIPAVSDGASRLARAIARDFFLADAEAHWQDLQDYAEPELLGDELAGETRWWPAVE
ncbi:MAG: NAD(P)-binding domain-containing protein [Gammaproteobacteria bacterium]